MSLSVRLNQLRLKKKASLQDVATAIGVSKTHVWELEKGKAENPSLEMLTKFSDYFEVTIRYLVGESLETTTDEGLSQMFRQVGELTDTDRAILDDMIKAMKKRRDNAEN